MSLKVGINQLCRYYLLYKKFYKDNLDFLCMKFGIFNLYYVLTFNVPQSGS